MSKVRLLHLFYSFNEYNGLIEILNILASSIDHSRFELAVCVFRYDGNDFGDNFERLGGKIYSLGIPKGWYRAPTELARLYRFVKDYKPDIVQTHALKLNLYGTYVAKWAGVPLIVPTEMTLRDIAPAGFPRFRHRMVQPFIRRVLGFSTRFMVTSEFIAREWLGTESDEKITVIHPPFSVEKYEAAIRAPVDPDIPRGPKIAYVGRLSEEKGVATLIHSVAEVAREIPDVRLLLIGTGAQEPNLVRLVHDLGIESNVHFLGFRRNPLETLKQVDLFALPSRTEGCPVVVLEAMAMGLPVVATAVGGTPELVAEGETGLLVPPVDTQAMAGAIRRLLSDRGLALAMGEAGRRRAFDHFHPSIFTQKLVDLYLNLLERKA